MNELALTQDDPDVAFNLVEAAHHLASMAKIMATKMKDVVGMITAVTDKIDHVNEVIETGIAKGCVLYAEHLIHFLEHPVDTFVTDLLAPFKLAQEAYVVSLQITFGSHEDRDELWEMTKHLAGHAWDHPDDAIAMGMQFFTPVPSFALVGAVVKIGKAANAQKIVAAIKNSKIGTSEGKIAGLQAFQPATAIVEHGAQVVQKAYTGLLGEARVLWKKFVPFDKNHVFPGGADVLTGKPFGFHLEENGGDRFIQNLLLLPDNHGVYPCYYKSGEWTKLSCFYPKTWSRTKTKKKIFEAFENPIKEGQNWFIGVTSEGIKIKVILKRTKQGEIIVSTAYPLYRGIESTTELLNLYKNLSHAPMWFKNPSKIEVCFKVTDGLKNEVFR